MYDLITLICLGTCGIEVLFRLMETFTGDENKYTSETSFGYDFSSPTIFQDDDLMSSFSSQMLDNSWWPSVNVDGTPMMANSGIDVHGNPFGVTDSFSSSSCMFHANTFGSSGSCNSSDIF